MLHAKNYYIRPMFHAVIQKNNPGTVFLRHGVHYHQPGFKHVIMLTSSTVIPVVNVSTTYEPEILGGNETVGSVNESCHQKTTLLNYGIKN